ncbi:hypothetical protein LEN26_007870 [Aphanomyces euteiches]|nr:hypothetical protein AeMF1_018958 [Aphanomyces euteiches]KAH9131165.1 hypothetical protein LEN26_007870 [Aphanomyces euteiches]KAH9190894.1 hypothetical protein AeNC1_007134 [Aphanomyces euteiches]
MVKSDEPSGGSTGAPSPVREVRKTRGRPPNREGKARKKRKLNKEAKSKRNDDDDEEEDEDDESEILDLCEICNINENDELSLICDACDKVYHTYCLDPPLKEIPPGEWVCPKCDVPQKEPEKAASEPTQSVETKEKSPPKKDERVSPQRTPSKSSFPSNQNTPHLPAIAPPALPMSMMSRSSMAAPPPTHIMPHPVAASFPHAQQERHQATEMIEIQDQNAFLRRENQKLMDWVDRLTRRIDELQPLEETLRATQYKCRKMESQILDYQSQLAMMAKSPPQYGQSNPHAALPKFVTRPYMPTTLPRVDGRSSDPRHLDADYRPAPISSGAHYLSSSRRKDYPEPNYESEYSRAPPHEESHGRRFSNPMSHMDSYYRESSSSAAYHASGSHQLPGPPLPYSQPPVYQKRSYPHQSYHDQAQTSSSHLYRERQTPERQSSYQYQPHSNSEHSFLPRPVLPTEAYGVKKEDQKEPIQVYSSDDDESSKRPTQAEREDDAISVLNSMKRGEPAPTERLNMSTPPHDSDASTTPLSTVKPSDIPSTGKRIGLYTPRSRRLMLDRYLLKRTKRLSRHKWFKYPVRKTLADTRPRVKGRFVKHDSVDDEEMSSPQKSESPRDMLAEEAMHISDFDYIKAFANLVKETKEQVDNVVVEILKNKQRQGELVSWDTWTVGLEQSVMSLLPREYVSNSPFPNIFGELVYVLGDAEEDSNQENYCKALQAGAIYVAICLSLYSTTNPPSKYGNSISPILKHYVKTMDELWEAEPNLQKKHTFAMMKSIVDGIAGVICVGYDDGKQFLQPVSVAQILDNGQTTSEDGNPTP